MTDVNSSVLEEALTIWSSGGWLMMPLFGLAVYIYYIALDLFLRVQGHFLLRSKVATLSDAEITNACQSELDRCRRLLISEAGSVEEVYQHFVEVRHQFLPAINRRILFLGTLIGLGPLVGLLGTVTGMLSTFDGMTQRLGDKLGSIVQGISEALITTQTGLIISIPALVLLALIVQRRNALQQAIARLERYNVRSILRSQVNCDLLLQVSSKKGVVS